MAALAELVARQRELLLAQVTPEVHVGEEVGLVVLEARVQLVGLLALVGRALARVLDRERRGDHDHLFGAPAPVGLEHHAAEPRIDRELREPAPERRQPLVLVERRELLQQPDPVAHLAPVGRVQEREVGDVAELRRRHLQDHRGEIRAEDLGIGEARALIEVLLGVEPHADALREPAAAALALVGRSLADRLDRQPLDLQPRAVAADPGGAGVDDVADARDGERRLGDVGGEHDAAAGVRPEHALLLARGEAGVERQHVDVGAQPSLQGLGGVADLALAGQEHEHVAGALAHQLLDCVADRVGLVALLWILDRAVADLDGIGAAGHLDDRRAAEVAAEALGIDRRRRDDQLQVGPARQDPRDVAEQEVDVEAALVRLVDDDRVVAAQQLVALRLGEQQAVGHQPHERVAAAAVAEADRVPDRLADRHAQLVRDPLGDRARRQPARLSVGDRQATELEADLRQLRRLARPRLARDHDDLVVADGRQQLVLALGDGELRRVMDRRHARAPALGARLCGHAAQR